MQCAIEPGFGEGRVGSHRAIEAVERELVAPKLQLRDADQVMRGGMLRVNLDGAARGLDAVADKALLALHSGEQKHRVGVLLLTNQHLLIARRGLRQLPVAMQGHSFLHQEGWGGFHGPSQVWWDADAPGKSMRCYTSRCAP